MKLCTMVFSVAAIRTEERERQAERQTRRDRDRFNNVNSLYESVCWKMFTITNHLKSIVSNQ